MDRLVKAHVPRHDTTYFPEELEIFDLVWFQYRLLPFDSDKT